MGDVAPNSQRRAAALQTNLTDRPVHLYSKPWRYAIPLLSLALDRVFRGLALMRTMDPTRGDHILEVAAQLFAKRHYHEVRMEDIALKAGVAKGTIYRYFEDKEDLY